MTQHPPSFDRLYALDNLRAVMMWLGVVLHVAVIYMVAPSPLPWHDHQRSEVADILVVLIHSFRMPVFFILAGFFVTMLVQRRGVQGMLKNRLMRLGLPFVLLWPVIYGVCGLLALLFVHRMVRGTWGIEPSLIPPREDAPMWNTLHLWFLWMLMWFSLFTAALAPLARATPSALRARLAAAFGRLAGSAWGFVVLAAPLALLGAGYKDGFVSASGAFLPPLAEWLHNGWFYLFGLALYGQRDRLLARYQRRWSAYVGAGLLCFAVALTLVGLHRDHGVAISHFTFWFALAYNACTWLWSFALIGLFLRYVSRPHPGLSYLAQSSYWVYLIHMPATIGFGALLYGATLPALIKMPLNIIATTAVSLLTYHFLVRSTPLSSLLNGRRYPFTLFRGVPQRGERQSLAQEMANSSTK
ncbi:acyltransferase family protein [Rhodoferax sp.]|uniref:acyltransferase family protein n=1 Tax=Rhodoferax sp. TaxID=50421 RepID=UPI00276ECD6D|nr:acyltransferase family protein [Rhodoferax sp.]